MRGSAWSSEQGYSVLEVTVALVLFGTVLVPAIGGVVTIMTYGSAGTEVQALAHAQRVMENTLHDRRFDDRTWFDETRRWAFQRSVQHERNSHTVTVRVWRARGRVTLSTVVEEEPTVKLVTTRLADEGSPETDLDSGPSLRSRGR